MPINVGIGFVTKATEYRSNKRHPAFRSVQIVSIGSAGSAGICFDVPLGRRFALLMTSGCPFRGLFLLWVRLLLYDSPVPGMLNVARFLPVAE